MNKPKKPKVQLPASGPVLKDIAVDWIFQEIAKTNPKKPKKK